MGLALGQGCQEQLRSSSPSTRTGPSLPQTSLLAPPQGGAWRGPGQHEGLASCGHLCRTIRFWDLEKFQVVSCIEGEPGPVRYAEHMDPLPLTQVVGCW